MALRGKDMRFDSLEHLDAYRADHTYPKIHNDVLRILPDVLGKQVMDLGACFGLISMRLIDCGASQVKAVEGNQQYLKYALRHERISWHDYYLTQANLGRLTKDLTGIYLVMARRVFPEISEYENVAFVEHLSELFARSQVMYILLEGRKKTKNPRNRLHSAQLEAQCFQRHYSAVKIHNDCILLKLKE